MFTEKNGFLSQNTESRIKAKEYMKSMISYSAEL